MHRHSAVLYEKVFTFVSLHIRNAFDDVMTDVCVDPRIQQRLFCRSRLVSAAGYATACPQASLPHRALRISSSRVRRSLTIVHSSSVEKVDESMEKLKAEAPRPIGFILDEEVIIADQASSVLQITHCRLSYLRVPSPSNQQISLLEPKRFWRTTKGVSCPMQKMSTQRPLCLCRPSLGL